jgi:hypothetical protein
MLNEKEAPRHESLGSEMDRWEWWPCSQVNDDIPGAGSDFFPEAYLVPWRSLFSNARSKLGG